MTLGEVVGLLGPNGAGKTTISYSIVGFLRPTAGKISLDGDDSGNKKIKPVTTSEYRAITPMNNS